MKFKEDGIGVKDLLKLIPEDLLDYLAAETKVDHQAKKLYGRNVFNLLLYGLLDGERVGLRTLQDFYNSRHFKAMFKLPGTKSVKYNSISARLANMNVDFFEKAYQSIYEQCSSLYDQNTLSSKYKITRVDSTMVCEAASKLEQGINVGCKKDGKKQIKYTVSLTNMFPSSVEVFMHQTHISEDNTIPKVIDKGQDNVFVFDRGVHSRNTSANLTKTIIHLLPDLILNPDMFIWMISACLTIGSLGTLPSSKIKKYTFINQGQKLWNILFVYYKPLTKKERPFGF